MNEPRRYSELRTLRYTGGQPLAARTIEEVVDEWNRRSGQNITRARVWQILQRAEEKVAQALKGIAS